MVCAADPSGPVRRDAFAEELDAAINAQGKSLDRLRQQLTELGNPVSRSALSYWRSGARRPEHASSLAAVAALEELLELPPRHLLSRLGPPRRSGPPVDSQLLQVTPPGSAEMVAALGLSEQDLTGLAEVTTQVVFEVAADGRALRATNRVLFRAVRDGARCSCQLFWAEDERELRPRFRAVAGCTLSPTIVLTEHHLAGCVLQLERPLRLGETTLCEYTVEVPAVDEPADFYELYVSRRTTEVVLWVRFHPSRVPVEAVAYHTVDGVRTDLRRTPMEGLGGVHHRFTNVLPGQVGMRWIW